jgi:arylsulfate sulfotransferase
MSVANSDSTTPASASPAPGIELLSLDSAVGGTLQAVATDLQGNIIWFCPQGALPVKPLSDGDFILLGPSDLREEDLTCNVVRDVSLAQVNQSLQAKGLSYNLVNFSHDVLTPPNGHWITIIQISKDFTDLPGYPGTTSVLGDLVVDIDPNGNVVWSWSAFDYLDINRYPYFGMPDWTHSNALVLTADNNLLLSMRNQSWILKLDYASGTGSGNVLWKLGQDGDFTLLGGDPSQWFYAQHYPNILSVDGSQTTLAIYDDGNDRVYSDGSSCGSTGAPACYSRATIFQIDESTSVANLLWQDLPGYFSFWGGSIDLLSNGDVEFDSSEPFNNSSSQITEVTYTDSPQIVWQMTVAGENAYRGYRIPSLYPGVAWQQ